MYNALQNKFNGNLFDLGKEIEDKKLTKDVFILLTNFFSGCTELSSGQKSLFNLYDFNIIPVELISNIYEILLGKEAQNTDEAFYTPNYLVEYILDQTIAPFLTINNKFTILDPSCGSGIFPVNSYRRMIEKHLNGETYSNDDSMLINILTKSIYGIDTNKDAIDVAIFLLYLTALDYKDPKTLKRFSLPNIKDINLIESDFFNESNNSKLKQLKTIKFDFIIGNPPWGSKTGFHKEYWGHPLM
jgi:type I restriction-modification system DNA methylase subunit